MALIADLPCFDRTDGIAAHVWDDPWPALVAHARRWAQAGLDASAAGTPQAAAEFWRDAVFLVPLVQHLPLARRAWAGQGGWMPRIETPQTLARSLAPALSASSPALASAQHQPLALSFDVCADRLTAARLLRGQPWAAAWARRDAAGFAQALAALVTTAHAVWRAAAGVAPAQREAHWAAGRDALSLRASANEPGGTERALARVAFEWAQASASLAPPATDLLFGVSASAWVGVQAGGRDALMRAVLAAAPAGTPCLWIDTDPPSGQPAQVLRPLPGAPPLQVGRCADFEDEAQRAAAQVLVALSGAPEAGDDRLAPLPAPLAQTQPQPQSQPQPQLPVALISLDRVLVRRIRALLARRGVAVLDETGWTLSTTRAAASLAGLLAAVQVEAGTDELLNGLKACEQDAPWPGVPQPAAALDALERTVRKFGWSRSAAVVADKLPAIAANFWRVWGAAATRFRPATALPPAGWMERLRGLLEQTGLYPVLAADEAGQQVLAALARSAGLAAQASADDAARADRSAGRSGRHSDRNADAEAERDADAMTPPQFIRWVEQVLEAASFVPAAPARPQVVITPLARAVLRPFAAIVVPGADERHLGGAPARPPLLSDAEAAALGLPDAAAQRDAELLAFAQLLRAAPVTLLHRADDNGEPLAESPLLARARLARTRAGLPWPLAPDPRVALATGVQPALRPQPVAPALLPARLSASACEALRTCPYRFFALRMLGLHESPELDDEVEKRDYGSWLHAVLHRFHAERAERAERAEQAERGEAGALPLPASEAERLHALALEVQRAQGIADAAFLPFAATFARFVPRYLAWLHARDAAGARWLDGEREFLATPPEWAGTQMHGVIDRIDSAFDAEPASDVGGDGGPLTQLIDYKTGSAQALRERVKRPQEDTQLAFYAALLLAQSDAIGEVGAVYLALDEADRPFEVPHPDVEATARQLVAGLGADLAELRGGAALPALGEGRACEFCEARGLCRRDQWVAA